MERLSQQAKQQRADTLLKLHNEPPSFELQTYFKRLEEGSPTWDIDTLIEGAKCLANLSGPGRVNYYSNALKGLHYANSFTELLNRTYSQQPITIWDQDIRYQCPPSWSNRLEEFRYVLRYQGEANLSQGLNDLLQGPTTLDCGMFCQLLLWMAIRYVIGDEIFDISFKFQKGQFALTQCWEDGLLEPFYDDPFHCVESQPRIQIRTFYNHPNYLSKHPGGVGILQNVVQIDACNMLFEPDGTQNVLSTTELEHSLIHDYNSLRNFADFEKLWFYMMAPDYVHPDFAPRNYGTLAEEAEEYADHILNEAEWGESRAERERKTRRLHRIFNFPRLIDCLKIKDAPLIGNILFRASIMKIHRLSRYLAS